MSRPSLEVRRRAIAEAFRAIAVEARLDALSRRSTDMQTRLDSVETALLESTWEQPAPVNDPTEVDERVPVPKLSLDEGRMSSTAARALFGG